MAGMRNRRPRAGGRSYSRLGDQAEMASDVATRQLDLAPRRQITGRGSKILVVFLLAGCLMMVYAFLLGPKFLVSQVTVDGANLAIPSEVRRVADVDYANIFQVDARRLEQRLVAEFGCVASARVRCRLPNRIEISLKEFDAPTVWESLGSIWWVDGGGKVLGRARDPGSRMVIHDTQGLMPEPTDHIVGVPWELVSELGRALPGVKELDYDPGHGLVLRVTASRWPVYLGHLGNAGRKVALMQALVDRLTRNDLSVEYIDLRDEQRPTYKAH